MATAQQGSNDQFDDLIMDPENNAEDQESTPAGDPVDDWSVPLEEEKPEEGEKEGKKEEVDKDSQLNPMDEKEDKPDDKEDKDEDDNEEKPKEDKEEKEDKEDESKPDDREETPKVEGKSVKIFKDGKKYEIPEDGTVKVKVAGKSEKVTISELRNNYSGKVAYDKKFTELSDKEKEVSENFEKVQQTQNILRENIGSVRQEIESAVKEGKNPISAINKIVDLLGYDSYDFNEVLFESMMEEYENFSMMDEAERRAYKLEKRNEHLTNKQESFQSQQKQAEAQKERLANVDRQREAHGVSEEEFVSAFEELSQSLGKEDISPEQVIKYADSVKYLKPAEELLSPYEEQLSDSEMEHNMMLVANVMRNNPELTNDEIAEYLKDQFVVEDAIEEINNKADKAGNNSTKVDKSKVPDRQVDLYKNPSYESFDDII